MKNIIKNKKSLIYKIIGVLVIASIFTIGGYYFATKTSSVAEDNQKMLEETIADVSKLMVLPQDETPTLATVTDIKKLEGQPFFANAKEGDKVLIYTNNKKVILYSPSMNKIIEVGSVNLNSTK